MYSLPLYRVEAFVYMSLIKDYLINHYTKHETIQHLILQECHYLKGQLYRANHYLIAQLSSVCNQFAAYQTKPTKQGVLTIHRPN
jgi:hypothetical protein